MTTEIYNLSEVVAAPEVKTVLWVEGEHDAKRLTSLGFLATGATNSLDMSYLKGRRVVIIPTNDDLGRAYGETVYKYIKKAGGHPRILHLSGLKVNEGVSDWLDEGHTREELQDAVKRSVGSTVASSVVTETTDWMWNPRIPAKGLTMFFGEAGIGKSTMMMDLIARWTNGDHMPETVGTFKPINVAMFGMEDDIPSVVVPRLMAAGADLSRVFLLELDTTKPVLPNQIDRIRQLCSEVEAGVLVFDNIENSMTSSIDTNSSKSLRTVLSPLSFINIPVMAIHHPKGSMMGRPTDAMSGSQAYQNVARSVMEVLNVGEESDGVPLIALAAVKSNYAPVGRTRTLYFRLDSRFVEGSGEQPYCTWIRGDNTSAEQWHLTIRKEMIDAEQLNHGGRPKLQVDLMPHLSEWIKTGALAFLTNVSQDTVTRRLKDFVKEGTVECRGEGSNTEYRRNTPNILLGDNINIKDNTYRFAEVLINPDPIDHTTEESIKKMKSWVEEERKKHLDRDTEDVL